MRKDCWNVTVLSFLASPSTGTLTAQIDVLLWYWLFSESSDADIVIEDKMNRPALTNMRVCV